MCRWENKNRVLCNATGQKRFKVFDRKKKLMYHPSYPIAFLPIYLIFLQAQKAGDSHCLKPAYEIFEIKKN